MPELTMPRKLFIVSHPADQCTHGGCERRADVIVETNLPTTVGTYILVDEAEYYPTTGCRRASPRGFLLEQRETDGALKYHPNSSRIARLRIEFEDGQMDEETAQEGGE